MFAPLEEPVPVFLTIMAVILLTPLLSQRLRLPGIVGLILGGVLVGPYVLGLLPVDQSVELLATVGLLYLMFSAGLEIDLRQFSAVRNKALLFGLLTFSIPQVVGTVMGRVAGFSWNSSILLGSVFASHTLVAFPLASRMGIVGNRAVAATIGATVFTDVGSLLVLAVVANASAGTGSLAYVLRLVLLMGVYAVLVLAGLPRLGKQFFRRVSGRALEVQFVLVALLVSALLAERIGMHAIVGAFLAGLAINSTVPAHSPVVGQVLFLGESLFVPIFLIYVGMITNPLAIVASRESIIAAVALTTALYSAKLAAAWLAGRVSHYSRDEILTMWGFSQAQAAATLAAVLVGVEIGLFPQYVFNGAIMMIISTCVTSPLIVQRFGSRLQTTEAPRTQQAMFDRILVPIANPQTQEHLIRLAGILGHASGGLLMPLNVAQVVAGQPVGMKQQKRLLDSAVLQECDIPVQPLGRVDGSIAQGVLHAAMENDASLIVMGWRGKPALSSSVLGTVLDKVVWNATVPVLVGRITMPIYALQGVLLVVPPGSQPGQLADRTVEAALALARAVNVPLRVLAAQRRHAALRAALERLDPARRYDVGTLSGDVVQQVAQEAGPQDLVMVTAMGSRTRFRSSLGQIPEQLAGVSAASVVVIRYPAAQRRV